MGQLGKVKFLCINIFCAQKLSDLRNAGEKTHKGSQENFSFFAHHVSKLRNSIRNGGEFAVRESEWPFSPSFFQKWAQGPPHTHKFRIHIALGGPIPIRISFSRKGNNAHTCLSLLLSEDGLINPEENLQASIYEFVWHEMGGKRASSSYQKKLSIKFTSFTKADYLYYQVYGKQRSQLQYLSIKDNFYSGKHQRKLPSSIKNCLDCWWIPNCGAKAVLIFSQLFLFSYRRPTLLLPLFFQTLKINPITSSQYVLLLNS